MKFDYLKYKLKNHAISGRDFFLDLLFPISCQICSMTETHLCVSCKNKLILNKTFTCPSCKIANTNGAYCKSCLIPDALDGLWISADYHDQRINMLIKNYKYYFNKALAASLADLMLDFMHHELIEENPRLFDYDQSLVMAVPLHKKRKKFRGFNQSELLAKHISKSLNLKSDLINLRRHKNTKAQAKLSRSERIKNVTDAFSWSGGTLENKNIILVDDVSSTETTLNNCAKVLKDCGAREVWGLVIAKN